MWIAIGIVGLLAVVIIYDLVQTKHAILRNFPVIGHFRYMLETIGPELRQYIVTSNDEERPFSRDHRTWVYASSKKQNNYFGFGTDNDLETAKDYIILKQSAQPTPEPSKGDESYDANHAIACAKVVGEARNRPKAFTPESIFYISAMSYGSLSSAAVTAINRGVAHAGGLHNTGEGGIAPYHDNGGDLIWQLGTGYFGARGADGNFDLERLVDCAAAHRVRAIEIKLSQGAKPGRGGVLPGAKVTPEIAACRGVPVGKDVISPAYHREFRGPDEMLDFVEKISQATGLPVGIKSAVGESQFWVDLADLMAKGDRGVDYIAIDGGEGGTGAAPLVFSDHVSLPFKIGFARVYNIFLERDQTDDIVWMGSGRLGFPIQSIFAMALGCDMVGMAREAMLAIGCIQAQRCQTGHCPTGVATQNKWLMRGLDPHDKGARLANYLVTLRKEVMWLTRAAGCTHPSQLTLEHFELLDGLYTTKNPRELFNYPPAA